MKILFMFKSLLIVLLALSVFSVGTAYAESSSSKSKSKQSKSSKYKTRKAAAMSQKVFKKLQKIQELIDAKDFPAASKKLSELREARRLSPYEKAQAWNLSAYVLYLEEKYPEAIQAYQKVLDQGELPEALEQSTLKTMSQLYFATEKYAQALQLIKRLIAKSETPSADMYMLLGQAHFQLKNYKEALVPIKKAVKMYSDKGRKPKEQWLQLLRVIYHFQDDFKNMRQVLEQLVQLYPKTIHIRSLAGVYSELGDTEKQLNMMEILYERDYKQSSAQIINLANLYLLHDVPIKAATMLDKELNVTKRVKPTEQNYRLLSQAWYQAREDAKSIPPLRKAAEMSNSGELYIRMAQSYQNIDKWAEAVDALRTGIKKGGLKRVDTAELMLGMALFNLQQLEQAQKHFALAQKDKRSQKVAGQWIAFTKNELHRKSILEASRNK